MATRSTDVQRKCGTQEPLKINEYPIIADDIIYKGSLVGDNGSGLARPLVAQDVLLGLCERQCDNTGGAASALNVMVREEWTMEVAVVGAASADDVGLTVYASDDDTFTLTSTSNTAIGKVIRWVSSTTCVVFCQAAHRRSI